MPRKKKAKVEYPYKFGRRPPKKAPALRFSSFFTGVVPTHPKYVDYLSSLANWLMLGNDQYGDCVAVAWANITRLFTHFLAPVDEYPSQSEVFDVYRTQNPNFPNDDNGMDIQTLLEYLHTNGGPDGRKLVAFAKVDTTRPDEVEAAIAIFGGVMFGFLVRENNMAEFDSGNSWTYDPSQPVLGGHAVVVGGYDDAMGYRFVTWAEETSFDATYFNSPDIEEAWVMIFPEHLGTKAFQQGVDLAALAADYQALTGDVLPVPVPPTPTPTPTPTPVPGPSILQVIWDFLVALWHKIFG